MSLQTHAWRCAFAFAGIWWLSISLTKKSGLRVQMTCKMYAEFSGKSEDEIREEIYRDNFLSPAQAKELGIIDSVLA